jgi:predicted GNAT family N-acyltransferase
VLYYLAIKRKTPKLVKAKKSKLLRVIVTKNQRNRGHGRKIDFAHTLPV